MLQQSNTGRDYVVLVSPTDTKGKSTSFTDGDDSNLELEHLLLETSEA